MADKAYLNVSKARDWAAMCREALSAAEDNAKLSCPMAAQMLMCVAQRFCVEGPPRTGQELRLRRRQMSALSSIMELIAFANDLAKLFSPVVAGEILQEAKKLCNKDLPRTPRAFAALKAEQILVRSRMEDISREHSIHHLRGPERGVP